MVNHPSVMRICCLPHMATVRGGKDEDENFKYKQEQANKELNCSVLMHILYCTCSRAVGRTLVTGWRHRRHHQVEGYGNIHSSHVARARPNHSYLIVSLKVHVGRTSS